MVRLPLQCVLWGCLLTAVSCFCPDPTGVGRLQVQQKGTQKRTPSAPVKKARHCTSEACESCVLHRSCSPGFGVKQIATGVSDTICEPCPVGFFSSVSSAFEKCHPWTRSPGSAESPGGDPHHLRVPVCHPLGAGLYQKSGQEANR
uniref:CD40 molecule n=1 Tax=Nomascus leucogenys TaxID=61853 RepID=A0A2I3H601_NOMLE